MFVVQVRRRVRLEGAELEAYRKRQKEKEAEEARLQAAEKANRFAERSIVRIDSAYSDRNMVVLFQGGDGQQRRERGGAGDGLHDHDVNLHDDTGGGDDVRRRESVAARHRHEERGELHFSHCACACARFT